MLLCKLFNVITRICCWHSLAVTPLLVAACANNHVSPPVLTGTLLWMSIKAAVNWLFASSVELCYIEPLSNMVSLHFHRRIFFSSILLSSLVNLNLTLPLPPLSSHLSSSRIRISQHHGINISAHMIRFHQVYAIHIFATFHCRHWNAGIHIIVGYAPKN